MGCKVNTWVGGVRGEGLDNGGGGDPRTEAVHCCCLHKARWNDSGIVKSTPALVASRCGSSGCRGLQLLLTGS